MADACVITTLVLLQEGVHRIVFMLVGVLC